MIIASTLIGVIAASILAMMGYSLRRLITHLDKIDTTVNKLRIDIAVLFDRSDGIQPLQPERKRVAKILDEIDSFAP